MFWRPKPPAGPPTAEQVKEILARQRRDQTKIMRYDARHNINPATCHEVDVGGHGGLY